MTFWILLLGLNLLFWVLRSKYYGATFPVHQSLEQFFFFGVIAFALTFFEVLFYDFKSGNLTSGNDPQYVRLRFAALILASASGIMYFCSLYFMARGRGK